MKKKREYTFETHTYAPEMNKAFKNGVRIPGYTPTVGTHESMLRDIRAFFHKGHKGISIIVTKTGATKTLGEESFTYDRTNRKLFLSWLNSHCRGNGDFITGKNKNGSFAYTRKHYDYKIVSLTIYTL